jgi:hypothetical protein
MNRILKLRNMFLTIILTMFLIDTVQADPIIGDSQNPNQPAVQGEHNADGWGVHGKSNRGTGVVGTSSTWYGVYGGSKEGIGTSGFSDKGAGVEGQSKTGYGTYGKSENASGVFGTSTKGVGVEGQSTSLIGVYGATKSKSAAGGEFQNSGGGDLIRAGKKSVFRVLNNGDVLVRGQKIGSKGDPGMPGVQGPKGDPGPQGPAVSTVAVCADMTGLGNPTCPCTNRTVTRQAGACTVTSDTGSCSAQQNGCCAVCTP